MKIDIKLLELAKVGGRCHGEKNKEAKMPRTKE